MNIEKVLYNLQKFQIIQTKLNTSIINNVSDAYAYSWDRNLFPLFSYGETHKEFENQFEIKRDEIDVISTYADDNWLENKYFSFYEYENIFSLKITNVDEKYRIDRKIDRHHLIAIFRYMFLCDMFNDEFWKALLENGKCPIEAFSITRKFTLDELSLMY